MINHLIPWFIGIFLVFMWIRIGWIECGTSRSTTKRKNKIAGFFYGLLIAPAVIIFAILYAFYGPRR